MPIRDRLAPVAEPLADTDTASAFVAAPELQAYVLPQDESLSPPPNAGGAMVRYGGLALVLPFLQQMLDPLDGMLDRWWGTMPGYYRPRQLLEAFLLYLLVGYRNPEQTKAAPAQDFGPLLGRKRAPCCATLRAKLPALAVQESAEPLQEQLALQYLRLGWVQLGWWLVDGHFSPYFGQQTWAKSWWPQRRMPQRGYIQDWVHDRRGRPLCMHLTQGFECFGDQLAPLGQYLFGELRGGGVRQGLGEEGTEAAIERKEIDVFDGFGAELVAVELAATLGAADVYPVGRTVRRAGEACGLHKGFQKQGTVGVASGPVVGKLAGSQGEDARGQEADGDPGQKEEPRVVHDEMQTGLPLLWAPADEVVTRRDLPCGGAETKDAK